jgi:histidyl-tRNA synthetase
MVDLLPPQIQLWQQIEATARDHFRRAGVAEIRTPLLEHTELFARGIGEATDVVGKEMYTFLDRGERSCTLRPEGTASVVRAAIEHGLLSQGAQRLWYSGPMFRYERPQAGRQRQFHQIGVEWLGVADPISDAEVIALAWDLLAALGVGGLALEINSLGSPADRAAYRTQLVSWLEAHQQQLDADSQARIHSNPLRVLDSKNPDTQALLAAAPTLASALSPESQARFAAVQDGLVEQLGGPPTAAIGWALGMERLVLLLEQRLAAADRQSLRQPPDLYVVSRGAMAESAALRLAVQLRRLGLAIERDSSGSALAKQFKRAERSGAAWVAVIDDEAARADQLRLKPVSAQDQPVAAEETLSLGDHDGLLLRLRPHASS